MRCIQTVFACFALTAAAAGAAWSTPSTLIFIPSTDVQAPKTWHFGSDVYFTPDRSSTGNITDVGLTYGLPGRFEIGFDFIGGTDEPLLGNAKWQLTPEKGNVPAVALGGYNLGGKSNSLAGNLLYALVSKTLGKTGGRVHLGYQHGEKNRIGGRGEDMLLAAYEKQINPKWWAAIDFASGKSTFGALTPGVAYAFSQNTSVLFGYDFYNNGDLDNTVTVQVDINF
jgi:hypothetical protein